MRTRQEWRKVLLLAQYTRLTSAYDLQETEANFLQKVKSLLEEDFSLSEDDLEKALKKYQTEVLPKRDTIIRQKAADAIADISAGILKQRSSKILSVSENNNSDLYFRTQEVIAMGGWQILAEEEKKANVTHTMFFSINSDGDDLGGHAYHFSFR